MKQRGLYGKYTITKTETGEPVEGFALVLKPDADPHARWALAAYANSIRNENPTLARNIDRQLLAIKSPKVLGGEVQPEDRKFRVVGDHIEPSVSSITYGSILELLGDFESGDLEAALDTMVFEHERISLFIELVKLSDEQLAALEEYDP